MRISVTEFTPLDPLRSAPEPVFAIGDVHGHPEPLSALLTHLGRVIDAELAGRSAQLVFLGDYVDRGPDPLGVFSLVRDGLGRAQVSETALIGNHDWFLIAAAELRGERMEMEDWDVWLRNGGRDTLGALGEFNYSTARPDRLRGALGPENVSFLEGLSYSTRFGDLLCVHAGVDPTEPLQAQRKHDLMWIREPFLEPAMQRQGEWPPGVLVVHGHTPSAWGLHPHRIGVDTGGFATGVFTAVEIRDGAARFHHAVTPEADEARRARD
ncbi:MAG: metallophosphoesterase [Pseudomonadota bacterium]